MGWVGRLRLIGIKILCFYDEQLPGLVSGVAVAAISMAAFIKPHWKYLPMNRPKGQKLSSDGKKRIR